MTYRLAVNPHNNNFGTNLNEIAQEVQDAELQEETEKPTEIKQPP